MIPLFVKAAELDLQVTALETIPQHMRPGDHLSLECNVENSGSVSINTGSYLGYYLSEDAFLDESDTYLSSDYVGSLNSGNTSYESYIIFYMWLICIMMSQR